MQIDRRHFFGLAGAAAGSALLSVPKRPKASPPPVSQETLGCLVDTTLCIGCRKCEQACKERHSLPEPDKSFEDLTVFEAQRRPDAGSYTVVNRYAPGRFISGDYNKSATYVKFQCMHCVDPACVSACLVGALTKRPEGPVIYDASKCIGCRYCMVACPFQIPAFEFHVALTPEIKKCTFCFEYIKKGELPACARICPTQAMTFGKRADLLKAAEWKIKSNPGKYVDHIYGEHEVGGTSWMYIAAKPFAEIGLPRLVDKAPPRLTEALQSALFQFFAVPLGFFALFGAIMWITGKKKKTGSGRDTGVNHE
ncbi:MAG: 4Fe-4S dicluster domain-containing protein [Deltaproteobacteria bacterium]|nr:4Fe-4S dicluster domain-containing protein [Deltaproteobacteria bacterium]